MNATLLSLVVAGSMVCGQGEKKKLVDLKERDRVVDSINDFGFAIHNKLSKDGMVISSPPSVATVMTLLMAGANGETESELRKALGLGDATDHVHAIHKLIMDSCTFDRKEEGVLRNANSLWVQDGLRVTKRYKDLVSDSYRGQILPADFRNADAERRRINDWVSNRTEKKIPSFLSPADIDQSTRVVVVNTIYLNSPWQIPFKKESTKKSSFSGFDGTKREIDFMCDARPSGYYSGEGISMLRVPYNSTLCMYIVLPDPSKDLRALEKKLKSEDLKRWTRKIEPYFVNISIPRMKLDGRNYLREPLASMGVSSVFGSEADFSRMTSDDSRRIRLKDVVHEVYFSTDEKGTEAAAATAGIIALPITSSPPRPLPRTVFHADRPFLFFVMDDVTGLVLFVGRYAQ